MSEIVADWSLFDRLFALFLFFAFLAIPMALSAIDRKLERIIRLLEVANNQRDN